MKKLILFLIPALIFLVGCAEVDLSKQTEDASANSSLSSSQTASFRGTKGQFISLESNEVTLEAAAFDDGKAHYYNTTLPSGDPVYYFIIKSPDGQLRAAANGCQVCGDALQGFRQEGDYMVCNTCGNQYPLNKIATEKGGCNPAPIKPDLKVENGNISISLSDLKSIRQFFE